MKTIKRFVKKLVLPAYKFILRHKSKRKISQILKDNSTVFLEVGAGQNKGRGNWITLDMNKKCDLYWDLRDGIPFPNESIKKIYSSHFFEHLTFAEGQLFLDECFRVLKPGGIFSICVPNARLFVDAYLRNFSEDKELLRYLPAVNQTTAIDYLNYIAYMNGHHKYMFDQQNLLFLLKEKKFQNVHAREFDADLDKVERDSTSIYAEAIKPLTRYLD